MTNKVTSFSDLSTIKKCLKNINAIDLEDIILPQSPQSKSYFKILDIPYLIEDNNIPITSSIVKNIIKATYIFNNICLTFKSYIIKALPKSDVSAI